MKKKKASGAPAVDRAFDLIEIMAVAERELSLSELLERTKIPRQTLIRILNTMCDRGYVDRAKQRGFYKLGINFLYLGNRLQEKINLRTIALPFMEELVRQTGKAVELATVDRDQLFMVERIEGTEGIRFHARVGSVYPYFHAICVGKLYLAHMNPDKRRKILIKVGLPAVTDHTITNMDKLEKDLLRINKAGYAFENQELKKGLRRLAAPIYDFTNKIVGSICIASTVFGFDIKDKEKYGNIVKEFANRISTEMGNREVS